MGANDSTLRVAATLESLSDRGYLSSAQLAYINTKDNNNFYKTNKKEIEEYICDLYGEELKDLVRKGKLLEPVIDDIAKYDCHSSNKIRHAIYLMIDQYDLNTLITRGYLLKLRLYITMEHLIESIRLGDIKLYNEIKSILSERHIEAINSPPFTTTGLTLEEISTIAIMYSIVVLAMDVIEARLLIMRDILKYMEYNGYIQTNRMNAIVNSIGSALSNGRILHFDEALMKKVEGKIIIPKPSIDEQLYIYNQEFRHILASYPKPRPQIK